MSIVVQIIERIEKLEKNFYNFVELMGTKSVDYETHFGNLIKQTRELDQDLSLAIERIDTLEKRLGQIESILEYDKEVHNRLEKLETYCALLKINDLRDIVTQYAEEAKETFNKKPHKCPVCNGFGSKNINEITVAAPRNHYRKIDPCHVCQGKGIVWS